MSELTLSEMERLVALQDAERTFQMDEDAFRRFYDGTARPLLSYLVRITGDARHADDLLQESYYRFLRADAAFESEEHRRRYLFRIATNLARDHRRRDGTRPVTVSASETREGEAAPSGGAAQLDSRIDVGRAMDRLKPRERTLLSLAYVQGWSHAEIAASLGLRTASLKALLWRARKRFVEALRIERPGGAR